MFFSCFLNASGKITDEMLAKQYLEEYNSTAEEVWNTYIEASWTYNTDITEANKEIMVRPSLLSILQHHSFSESHAAIYGFSCKKTLRWPTTQRSMD